MRSINEFIKSFGYAIKGIVAAYPGQRNIKVQTVAAIVAIGLGLYLQIEKIELIIVMMLSFLVILLEMINTAIEGIVDEISLERKASLGRIKDIAAGAVLVAATLSVIVGSIIFFPYFYS
jgi:undecaprenol kinase